MRTGSWLPASGFWLRSAAVVLALGMSAGAARAESAISHVVRPGDTLASIAERYYGDPRRENVLVAENGLTTEGGSAIVTGLRLSIPTVFYHRVQEGEIWTELARRIYGFLDDVSVGDIANGSVATTPQVVPLTALKRR